MLNKQNEIFDIRIFRIRISPPKSSPCFCILSHLKGSLKNASLWAHFRGLCNVDLIHFYLYGICNLTKVATRRIMLLNIFQTFSEQIFIRKLWTATIICNLSYFEKQLHAKKVFFKNFTKFTEKTPVLESLSKLQVWCISVNFVKHLRGYLFISKISVPAT